MRRSEHNRIVENLNRERQFIFDAYDKVIKSHSKKIKSQNEYISKLEDNICEGAKNQQKLLSQILDMQLKIEELKQALAIKAVQ